VPRATWMLPALAGLAGLVIAAVVLRLMAWGAPAPPAVAVDVDDWFDPAAVEADRPFRRGLWALAGAGVLLTPLAVVAAARWDGRWRPALVRAARGRPAAAGLLAGAGLALLIHALQLPVAAARFAWTRAHGVTVQPTGDWLADRAVAAGIEVLLLAAAGALLALAIARLPRTWWLALGGAAAALAVLWVAIAPHVVAPLFERTVPVRDQALRAQVLELADRAGVPAGDVRVSDASARTTTANARVEGLGGGRRIVLYDTLLDAFPPDQVRMVVAHELAHVRARHIVKGTAWFVAMALPLSLLLYAVAVAFTGTAAPDRGRGGCDLVVRRIAVLAAAASVLAVLALPLQNAVSRSYEREADAIAVRLTGGDTAAATGLIQGLVARARNVPDPPAPVVWWFGTHPPAVERIARALGAGDEAR
jgi:STE24 endopeptidase